MSQLQTLRSQLASLRRRRQMVRLVTAFSALATAVLVMLGVVYFLDVVFELIPLQRIVVILLGLGGCYAAFHYFTLPLLGTKETDSDMALMVERQQGIDSDLIAALQFESPDAVNWGSKHLETAVIDYVAQLGRGLNVFEGFDQRQMVRRGLTLLGAIAVWAIVILIAPNYFGVFLERLTLASTHYPTDTQIELITVNGTAVLTRGSLPDEVNAAESFPVTLEVRTGGVAADSGKLYVRTDDSQRPIDLKPLDVEKRRSRLELAKSILQKNIEQRTSLSPATQLQVRQLLHHDAQELAQEMSDDDYDINEVHGKLGTKLRSWTGEPETVVWTLGDESISLADNLRYQVFVGDAWTDEASIKMIPLPVVSLQIVPTPPDYAKEGWEMPDPSSRQLSVLEGSHVDLDLVCANGKVLDKVWIDFKTGEEKTQRFDLVSDERENEEGQKETFWKLPADTPFELLTEEMTFEIQVLDQDGLQLPNALRGSVRLKPDLPPSVVAQARYRAATPSGKPTISYRMHDDYAIGKVVMHMTANRAGEDRETIQKTVTLSEKIISGDALTKWWQTSLDLAALQVDKGDQVAITIEVFDERGELKPLSGESDRVVFDILDASGVRAAVLEADEASDKLFADSIDLLLGAEDSP